MEPTAMQRTASSRFSMVESFHSPRMLHKRDVTMMDVDDSAPTAKRQRVSSARTPSSTSFSFSFPDRLSNWLLPTPSSTAQSAAAATPSVGKAAAGELAQDERSSQFFPFKQRATPSRAKRANRSTGSAPKSSSTLQSIEQWFFTDREGNPRASPFPRKAPFS